MTTISIRKGSDYKSSFDQARRYFAENHWDGGLSDPKRFWKEFGEYLGANIEIEYWIDNFPKPTDLHFNNDETFAWFLLRWA